MIGACNLKKIHKCRGVALKKEFVELRTTTVGQTPASPRQMNSRATHTEQCLFNLDHAVAIIIVVYRIMHCRLRRRFREAHLDKAAQQLALQLDQDENQDRVQIGARLPFCSKVPWEIQR